MPSKEVFERLKSLVGAWRGHTEEGRPLGVAYRLSAGDTVLVETWELDPGRESMTLYHMDGDALVATHYCPLGNQPRLVLATPAGPRRFTFDVASVSNLSGPAAAHQARFDLELPEDGTLRRSETYVEGDESATEEVAYTRVRRASAS